MTRIPWKFCLVILLVALTGCATQKPTVHLTGNLMVDGPMMITNGPPKDKVLWQYRTAAAAMVLGQYALAKELLDDALLTTGGISTDRSAQLARSYFHPESKKLFIGEPYERVMAYYYRGTLYWMDGEPDNARACFRSAAFQDADVENHKYSCDYVLLDYLDGLASMKLGADGSDAFKRAENEARIAKPPPYDPKANTLFFVECGLGPYKFASGKYEEELRFGLPPSPPFSAAIEVDGKKVQAAPYDDLFFQATTRGGRVMDHILGNKAVFKTTTDVAGTAAIIGGAIAASQNNRTSQQVGLGLMAAGLVSKIISASTTPAADTRAWTDLPRYLSFASLSLPPGQHTAKIEFFDQAGRLLPNLTKTININISSDGKDKVVFVSDKSPTPQTV
jgi:tetratricopeptide (TPR) repeat protein